MLAFTTALIAEYVERLDVLMPELRETVKHLDAELSSAIWLQEGGAGNTCRWFFGAYDEACRSLSRSPDVDSCEDLKKKGVKLDGCLVLVATETFSPYLFGAIPADEYLVAYTPNFYRQVKFALDIYRAFGDGKAVRRALVSRDNPYISYLSLRKALEERGGQDHCYYIPKLSGTGAIYLALKKLEREGLLKKP
ncbi:hypothetical protein [Pyrobaculum islandicum]|uniref:hypothetical protein n=1 Tax=Pyrobaculum islandicum TaxID=2277 RepID=UPI00069CD84F|nr:hypothetical protein [Pyrobaculum islandicum]